MKILLLGRKHIAKAEDIVSAMNNLHLDVEFLLFPNFHYGKTNGTYSTSKGDISIPKISSLLGYYFFHFSRILILLGTRFRAKKRYDVLFAIDWFEAVILLVYRTFFSRHSKLIFYSYDYYFFTSKFSSRYAINWIDAFLARRADEVWNVNDCIRIEREKRGVFARVNKAVPIGIQEKVDALSVGVNVDVNNERQFLFVGNLKTGHNLIALVEVFARLHAADQRFRLDIIGHGNMERTVRARIQELGAKQFISLRGFVSEEVLMKEITDGKFACGIALYENTREIAAVDPGKIKDYLSWGLPVVTTPYSASTSDIREYDLGFVANGDNQEAIETLFLSMSSESVQKKRTYIKTYVARHAFESILMRNLLNSMKEQSN